MLAQRSGIWHNACHYKMYRGQNFIFEYSPFLIGFWIITMVFILKGATRSLPNRNALLLCITSILLGLLSYFWSQDNHDLVIQIKLTQAWVFSLILCSTSFVLNIWEEHEKSGFICLMIFVFLGGYFSPMLLKMT